MNDAPWWFGPFIMFVVFPSVIGLLWILSAAIETWRINSREHWKRREQAMKEVLLARANLMEPKDLLRYAHECDHNMVNDEAKIKERVRSELKTIDLRSVELFYPTELKSVLQAAVQELEVLKIQKQRVARQGWWPLELKRLIQEAQVNRVYETLKELPKTDEDKVPELVDPEQELREELERELGRKLKSQIFTQRIRSEAVERLFCELRKREREIDNLNISPEDKEELKRRLKRDFEITIRRLEGLK